MKKFLIAIALATGVAGAQAVSVADFDSVADGTYSTLTLSGMTFTSATGQFSVLDADPGFPVSGNALTNHFQGGGTWNVDFAGGASSFSIGFGDYNGDADTGHLEAYNSLGQLLDADSLVIPDTTFGGGMLTVTSASTIAYARFYSTGDFHDSVYWDSASYSAAVPEPESYGLVLAGLLVVGALARRRIAA